MSASFTARLYRLEPNQEQESKLLRACGASRWLYNRMLDYREGAWLSAKAAGATGVGIGLGYMHMCGVLTQMRVEHPWLMEISSEVLRGAIRNLDRAFAAFYSRSGSFPRYKKRGSRACICLENPVSFSVSNGTVRLPLIGNVRFRQHRPLGGMGRAAYVSCKHGKWFVSFAVAGEFTLPNAGKDAIGLDAGIVQSVTTSSGDAIQFPVASGKEIRRLKFLQRQADRRKPGSNRQRGTYRRVANLLAKQARRRKDAAHKLSHRLATTHSVVAIEDLKIEKMTRSARGTIANPGKNVRVKAGFNREMRARGHSDFRRMLTYKCNRSGAGLVVVPPHHTSQRCSSCGHVASENRKNQADFECVQCGHTQNADHNAALNILAAGLAVTARGGSGITPACEPRTDRQAKIVRPE